MNWSELYRTAMKALGCLEAVTEANTPAEARALLNAANWWVIKATEVTYDQQAVTKDNLPF